MQLNWFVYCFKNLSSELAFDLTLAAIFQALQLRQDLSNFLVFQSTLFSI